jgi:hypothetical protein
VIIPSFPQSGSGPVLVSGVVIDDGDGPLGSGVGIVLEFVVLGIREMDAGVDLMMGSDLILVGDEVMPLKGISCQGGAGHGELDAEVHLDGGVDHGVVAEDLLFPVGILGISSDSDLGVKIRREPGTAEVKGVIGSHENDPGEDASFDAHIKAGFSKLILETKDPVEGVGPVRIRLLKGESEDFHFGPRLIRGKPGGGALHLDANLLSQDQLRGIPEPAKHPSSDMVDDALKGNGFAFFAEVGTSPVAGVGWKQGAVRGDDLVGEKSEELDDPDQDMKDAVVEIFSQPGLEVGKGGQAGDVTVMDARIEPVMPSPVRILEQVAEGLEITEFIEVTEEFEQEEADRIIGHTHQAVLVGHNGTDEGEVDQGRDHAGESAYDPPAGIDLDVSTFVSVVGEQKAVGLGKGPCVLRVDDNRNGVELFDHIANGKVSQVSQAIPLLKVKDSVVPQYSLDGSLVKRDIENFPDLLSDIRTGEAVLGPLVNHETDDFGGDFIGFGLTPWFVDQSGQPLCAERIEGLVEGFSGVAEFSTSAADESLLMAMGPEHFIFDLGRIAGIKEGGVLKQI